MSAIEVGDVFLDKDNRESNRRLRVLAVENEKALCQSVTGRGRQVRIALRRLRSSRFKRVGI